MEACLPCRSHDSRRGAGGMRERKDKKGEEKHSGLALVVRAGRPGAAKVPTHVACSSPKAS